MDSNIAKMKEDQDSLAQKRRAKFAQLKENLYVRDQEVTSAPDVKVVDEFQAVLEAAEKRKRTAERKKQERNGHKIFYAETKKKNPDNKESDLDKNQLVKEAELRGHVTGDGAGRNLGCSSGFVDRVWCHIIILNINFFKVFG